MGTGPLKDLKRIPSGGLFEAQRAKFLGKALRARGSKINQKRKNTNIRNSQER